MTDRSTGAKRSGIGNSTGIDRRYQKDGPGDDGPHNRRIPFLLVHFMRNPNHCFVLLILSEMKNPIENESGETSGKYNKSPDPEAVQGMDDPSGYELAGSICAPALAASLQEIDLGEFIPFHAIGQVFEIALIY